MITDGLIIALIAAAGLGVMGATKKSKPLIFVSSVGWMIAALQTYQQTTETLPMALLLMLAVGQFVLVRGE